MQLCVHQHVGMLEYVHHLANVHADMDGLEIDVKFVSYAKYSDLNVSIMGQYMQWNPSNFGHLGTRKNCPDYCMRLRCPHFRD